MSLTRSATVSYTRINRGEAALELVRRLRAAGYNATSTFNPEVGEHVGVNGVAVSWGDMERTLKEQTPKIAFKRLTSRAVMPTRGSPEAAGLDLTYAGEEEVVFYTGDTHLMETGLALAKLPPGTYLRAAPRSGLSVKGFFVNAGVIDADYRGEVKVVLHYTGRKPYIVQPGDRIAQAVLEQIIFADVEEVDELEATERGAGGYGSTGR